jgi:hypothetical protein
MGRSERWVNANMNAQVDDVDVRGGGGGGGSGGGDDGSGGVSRGGADDQRVLECRRVCLCTRAERISMVTDS